eukprot:scaffold4060_cov190-Amphora_coffeaeformis.AAC.11
MAYASSVRNFWPTSLDGVLYAWGSGLVFQNSRGYNGRISMSVSIGKVFDECAISRSINESYKLTLQPSQNTLIRGSDSLIKMRGIGNGGRQMPDYGNFSKRIESGWHFTIWQSSYKG